MCLLSLLFQAKQYFHLNLSIEKGENPNNKVDMNSV